MPGFSSAFNRGLEGHGSRLVQRLVLPCPAGGPGNDRPLDAPLGLASGDISMVSSLFGFDLMSPFECWDNPTALARIWVARVLYSPMVLSNVRGRDIYVLAPPAWFPEAEDRILHWADGDEAVPHGWPLSYSTYERVYLKEILDGGGLSQYLSRLKGWLELDNSWMFFIDSSMFSRVCSAYGIHSPASTERCLT